MNSAVLAAPHRAESALHIMTVSFHLSGMVSPSYNFAKAQQRHTKHNDKVGRYGGQDTENAPRTQASLQISSLMVW